MDIVFQDVIKVTVPEKYKVLPGVNDIHELSMALSEIEIIKDEAELIKRSAYYSHIKDKPTNIFQICAQGHLKTGGSNYREEFFKSFAFKTGYASHGLFPYRGKFHPQLVRGLLNILGIEEGQKILDPMGGSGTTAVEANIMNIDAVTSDISPFCSFMMKVKTNSLGMEQSQIENFHSSVEELFDCEINPFSESEELEAKINLETEELDLLKLAFVDTIGYSKRRKTGTFGELLKKVVTRYSTTLINFINIRDKLDLKIGNAFVYKDDARDLKLLDETCDGIITSPPYSFAINYVRDDAANLKFLGYDPKPLYNQTMGIRGRGRENKIGNYFEDMTSTVKEMYRVLKEDKYVCMVVGDNTRQTGGLKISEELIKIFELNNFNHIKTIIRPIRGMRNTMKEEKIMILKK